MVDETALASPGTGINIINRGAAIAVWAFAPYSPSLARRREVTRATLPPPVALSPLTPAAGVTRPVAGLTPLAVPQPEVFTRAPTVRGQ